MRLINRVRKRLCSLVVKISKLWEMKLLKTCAQNKRCLLSVFFSSLINIVRRKCVFKARERLLFSLFIIDQYCTPDVCYTTKNAFKTSNGLLFSLLRHFFNTKNMFSKQKETCFLIY